MDVVPGGGGDRSCPVVGGPLAGYQAGWRGQLSARGYSRRAVTGQMSLMAHLSGWMQGRGLAAVELAAPVAAEFLRERRGQGHSTMVSLRALMPLLVYLHGLQAAPDPRRRHPITWVEKLLEEYGGYLASERGLAPNTIRQYQDHAKVFLTSLTDSSAAGVENLGSGRVTEFMVCYSVGRNAWSAKAMVTALRSLLRYLHVTGWVSAPLASAVPCVPSRSLVSLPRGLDNMEVARLLGSCDRGSARGRRDYAIMLLLARLGLRAAEVAGLELDDIDWRAAELVIRGKGRRVERMPLPVDVGEALADYARCGRPRSPSRSLFLAGRAPWAGLGSTAVCAVVAAAGKRAGFGRVGAHRFRHAVACELLRRGAPLTEIGQLLRHRDQRTTAIYAKVDRVALDRLARPWPGASS
jgi:integrase/recombinase XerD